jgi:hypothetical protein
MIYGEVYSTVDIYRVEGGEALAGQDVDVRPLADQQLHKLLVVLHSSQAGDIFTVNSKPLKGAVHDVSPINRYVA